MGFKAYAYLSNVYPLYEFLPAPAGIVVVPKVLSLSFSFSISLCTSISYFGFSAVTFVDYVIAHEWLPISVSGSGTQL
jgi:hypothetical protein